MGTKECAGTALELYDAIEDIVTNKVSTKPQKTTEETLRNFDKSLNKFGESCKANIYDIKRLVNKGLKIENNMILFSDVLESAQRVTAIGALENIRDRKI